MIQGRYSVHTSCLCCNTEEEGKFALQIYVMIKHFGVTFNFLLCLVILNSTQANGGFIMSASHNPGGPEYDWGIKVILLFIL